jgi:hypothetical protein
LVGLSGVRGLEAAQRPVGQQGRDADRISYPTRWSLAVATKMDGPNAPESPANAPNSSLVEH